MSEEIYHEKQIKELCALHALNNLFQKRTFEKSELDAICETLTPNKWLNPHRSLLGLGNYDVNVLLTALQNKGYQGVWFDKRKDPDGLRLENIFGFILNIPNEYKIGLITLPIHRRHWIAIRNIKTNYYNLDSKAEKPQLLGDKSELITFLKTSLKTNDRELFIIVSDEVERTKSWLIEEKT